MPVSDAHIPHMEEVSERAHKNLALLYGGEPRRADARVPETERATVGLFPFLTESLVSPPRSPRLA